MSQNFEKHKVGGELCLRVYALCFKMYIGTLMRHLLDVYNKSLSFVLQNGILFLSDSNKY